MPGAKMLHAVAFLLRSTLKSRVAAVLIGVMVVLMMLSVGTRIAVVVGSGEDSFQPIRALVEQAETLRMVSNGIEFMKTAGSSDFKDQATILFDEKLAFGSEVPIETPEGLVVVMIPFIALLIGASLSPHRDSPVLTVLSAPIRRSTFYLSHVLALSVVLVLLCFAAWLGGMVLLLLTIPSPWQLVRLLTLMLTYSALYALVFGGVGLSLGILFRKRITALMAGVLILMILVGVMPSLRESIGRAYVANHREAYLEYSQGGAIPAESKIHWVAWRAVQHTPANAIRIILWITESYSPIPRAGCMQCGGIQEPGRGYSIRGEAIALAIAALISVSIGGVAFLRKEVGLP
ncbi:ABC transporter permease subunit [Candidatus Bipolaricaulota bacterium]|nr:ABC transporter permease subunit [Candidatus Bipolaricaulota bacterium]